MTLGDAAAVWSAPFSVEQINDVFLRVSYSDGRTPLYLHGGLPPLPNPHLHPPRLTSAGSRLSDSSEDLHRLGSCLEAEPSSFCVIRASVFQKDNGVTFVTFDRSEVT